MKIHSHYIRIIKAVLVLSMLILLWQYVKVIDPGEVSAALTKAGSGFGWIILSTFFAYALATVGWWYCLSDARTRVSWAGLFMIRHMCETVGMFTPASVAGGDLLKVVLLKPYEVNPPTVAASVVVSRLLMIVSQVCLLFCTVVWLFTNNKLTPKSLPAISFTSITVFIVLAITVLFTGIKLRHRIWTTLARNNARWLQLRTKIKEVYQEIGRFYNHYPRELGIAFLLFNLHWIVGSLEFYIILKLFGYPVSLVDALLLDMGVIAIKAAGAFIPGQLGVEELGNKMMLSLIGIASIPLWISVSALRRTRQLFWILIGVLFYSIIARKKRAFL